MFRLTTPARLRKAGVVGMNRRNVVLIARNNPRRLYPRVDDKLKTKKLTEPVGIPVPAMIGVARTQYHVKQLGEFLKDHREFVIKPSKFSDVFDGFSYEGVPDIRVILFHGYPVMAMTRLSTRESDSKANLHQGAVGLGIDIATGNTLKAVARSTGQPPSRHRPGLVRAQGATLAGVVESGQSLL